ncbi:MAG TPA: catechol 2,3-dioxygenase [Ilumatobacteraceae bacterium]|nr:catechol 2,3-dioxygenase [Ilumatobacteraceae bacterium]
MAIFRLGHVEVRTPDLELCAAYYTEVLGLREVARDDNHVYLKGWDEQDHHSLMLTGANRYGLEHVAFKTESIDDLEDYETTVEKYGCTVERISAGTETGQGEAIRFDSPTGHMMEIYASMEKVGNGLPLFNPPPMPMDLVGIAPPRLDHCLLTTENVPDAARFMGDVLGFRLTEQLVTNEGYQLIVFFERSRQPHDIAFTRGANGGLHHFAYWLDSWAEIGRAADILRMNGIDIDVGPTRHGITRGHTIYFFDPVGNRNEVFTGGYRTDTDWQTITWTEDQLGKALFFYENRVVDSFVSIYT